VCDCNSRVILWLKIVFCVCHYKHCWLFYDWKRPEPVCDCNYFACVIATRSYLWLQNLTESVWLKLLGYLWLQAWVVCDCKNNIFVCDCKNYFVCVIANTAGYFMTAKKSLNECVIATISRVWLQLFCVCDCNQNLFVVASWPSLCGKKLLVIYDCKPK
jgi:hypothetical protein